MKLLRQELFVSKPGDAGVAMGVAMYEDESQVVVWSVNLTDKSEVERYWGHYFLKDFGGAHAQARRVYDEKLAQFTASEYTPYLPYLQS